MWGRGVSEKAPAAILLSVPQMPVAITFTRTSSSPGCGSGTSVTSRGSENRLRTAALMCNPSLNANYAPARPRPTAERERIPQIGICSGQWRDMPPPVAGGGGAKRRRGLHPDAKLVEVVQQVGGLVVDAVGAGQLQLLA